MRQPVLAALCLLVAQSVSTAARADIVVRVDPDHIRQCRPAHFFASINNTSSQPIEVDVTASLVHGYRRASMSLGQFVIAAGGSHVEEYDFVMPPISQGNYTVTFRADLADHSFMVGTGKFTVTSAVKLSTCPEGGAPQDLLLKLVSKLADPIGGTTVRQDIPQFDAMSSANTTTSTTTWQTAKMLYR